MDLTLLAAIGLIALIVCIFFGMHIGVAMIVVGFFGYGIVMGFGPAMMLFKDIFFQNASSYSLVVVPLFILMGQIAYHSGLSEGLFNAAEKWLSRLRGGLAYATLVACGCFAAICGSANATAATMGVIAMPEMRKNKYDDRLGCGTIAAGGTLGILIPPSTGFIIYGIVAEQSIGRLFAGGIIPGILLLLCYCAAVFIQLKRHPDMAPPAKSYPMRERVRSLNGVLPFVVLFLVVICGMFAGFYSAVEASAIGVIMALVFMILNRKFSLKKLHICLVETAKMSGMLMFIVLAAYFFGRFLAVTNVAQTLATWVGTLTVSPYIIIFAIMILYVIMGCFMDTLALILLTVPIFLPMVKAMGFDPIWFGVLMVLVMQTGMITPPVGICCYITSGVTKTPLNVVFKGIWPMVIAILVATAIVVLVPQLALFLPRVLYP